MQPYHLPYTAGQTSMDDLLRRHKVRWLGHAARKPDDVMVMQLLFAHSIPGLSWGALTHLTTVLVLLLLRIIPDPDQGNVLIQPPSLVIRGGPFHCGFTLTFRARPFPSRRGRNNNITNTTKITITITIIMIE